MNSEGNLCANNWARCSSLVPPMNGLQTNFPSVPPPFYGVGIEAPFKEFSQPFQTQPVLPGESNKDIKVLNQENCLPSDSSQTSKLQDWDPNATLNNLSFLEEKIHQLQDLVLLIVNKKCQPFGQTNELMTQEQQLVTADLTSIIVQLITTAGSLLPSVRHTLTNTSPLVGQLGQLRGINIPFGSGPSIGIQSQNNFGNKMSDQSIQTDVPNNCEMQQQSHNTEEHEHKDEEDMEDGENLPPGSYEILQLEKEEILAPHTHFCTICGKGFKRDANLRMHMRGHGDEYKTPAALAKPHKETGSEPKLIKRYSCPYSGCKRNKEHKKFQPLKTILCVKNHYKRTHCDKSYICSRCHTKKFSVIADLKTHEKHCGKVRICYSAKLNIPSELTAVMAARHVERRSPLDGEADGISSWCEKGRVVEEFNMDLPVPPYLFAFAVGEIDNREVGPRTRVYAEAVPKVLDSAAKEFYGTEDMILEGEKLFGNYEWGRFDLLVLPPSFPYGGMENPRMTFLTPTVIKGDGTGAQVVAHELAHSWTGNLITNKTNEHFWLNEGFTTYAERRIVEAVQGKKRAELNIGIGWRGLNEDVERFKDNMEMTKLKNNQEGIDPDDTYSQIPYEKGFQFLLRIERQVGRPAFDEFLKKYIATFKFKSIDTETFLDFLKANIPGIENQIDLVLWTEGTGIPPDAYEPDSSVYTTIVSLANESVNGRMPTEDEVAEWQGQEWELYLDNLPRSIEVSQIVALDSRYKLSESKDYEVKVSFLQLAISCGCKDYYSEVEKTLKEVGRMKYLRPLYTALVKGNGKEDDKVFAKRIFSEARECYHPIAQGVVEAIFGKYI